MRVQSSRKFQLAASLLALFSLLLHLPASNAQAAARAPAQGQHGMVVSPQRDATLAGLSILEAGGNAVDAAVATAFALAVTDPYHSGLGGGGFILIRLADGRVVAIDARETAPAAATRDMYVAPGVPNDASRLGPLAVAVPGLVPGLADAQAEFGTLPLPRVLAPAIRLAEEGFAVGPHHVAAVRYWQGLGLAERFPETARIQLPDGETPIAVGWRLVQKDLARTLRRLARNGPAELQSGETARAIAAEVKRRGGLLTAADLAGYRTKRREPIHGRYRGLDVYSFPPPSSGGVALVEMLQILEPFDLAARGAGSSASLHVIAEAMKLAFADRAAWLGDPDFVSVPTARLVSRAHADALRARINPPWWRRSPLTWGCSEVAIDVPAPGQAAHGGGTTHLSVSDAAGNAVAITQTVNLLFGSGITVPGTGVVLNDEMDDFSVAPDTPNAFGLLDIRGQNAIAAGKRPLSSMTPTILVRDGQLFMVTGSPGGPRIITTTLETILNVVDYGMNVQEAVSAPRFHHQWMPEKLVVEPEISADVVAALRRCGHTVEVSRRHWSSAQSIVVDPASGLQLGGSDPRSDGLARGF